jgi:Ca2+:H+ antiporter
LIVAVIVLMPEGLSAIRAALANQLQRSSNIVLGSTVATIGLTIPAVLGSVPENCGSTRISISK